MPVSLSPNANPLLLVSLSGRALAKSAQRAEWSCSVIDAFADSDTRAIATQCVAAPAWNAKAVAGVLPAPSQVRGLVYGGGLEAMPEVLKHWFRAKKLLGNGPDILSLVNHPQSFFALLDRLGIEYPEVCFTVPESSGQWLVKQAASSGGGHVRDWTGSEFIGEQDYFQRYVEGPVISVIFLADGERSQTLGWNTQWTRSGDYLWAGAVNRADLNDHQRDVVSSYVEALVSSLKLRGLNSVDFVLQGASPKLLELNPRPGGTLELYDRDYQKGLLYWHVKACAGRLPMPAERIRSTIRACKVLYPRSAIRIPRQMDWAKFYHDRPVPGSVIKMGEPLCTVTASGSNVSSTLRQLEQRVAQLERQLLTLRQVA